MWLVSTIHVVVVEEHNDSVGNKFETTKKGGFKSVAPPDFKIGLKSF